MVSPLKDRMTDGRRECFWISERFSNAVATGLWPVTWLVVQSIKTAHRAAATTPRFDLTLLWFQRNEAAAALAPDADQNLFLRLQFLADGHQVLRVLDRLLVYFLDHVAFAQASFCSGRLGTNFRNHSSFD